MNLNYTFPKKLKNYTYLMMAVGALAILLGFFTDHDTHGTRVWANIYVNSFFFFGIATGALFFIAVQYAAEAAWAVALKRVFEGISSYIVVGAITLIIVWLAGAFHLHHIFHWMDPEVYDVNSPKYDEIIAGKRSYLNQPFFWVRALFFLGVWIYFARLFRKRSLEEDLVGGVSLFRKNVTSAAIFLVFFGFTSSVAAWDWIMSIDTHWFSTLFGWYVFSGMWISAIIFTTLLTIFLKSKGYLPHVNESHLHDMGKWMFALSFLWCYLWFSQFMLIWYSDIPEEVTYYLNRIDNYKFLFFFTFCINFFFPMLLMMSRDAKRNTTVVIVVGIIIFIGHWLDAFLMIMPGSVFEHWRFGFVEIGALIGFLGLFLNIVLVALTKAPLEIQKHPYLEESVHHHI